MTIVCDIAAAARPGCRAKKGLPILRRLRERANQALVAARKYTSSASADSPIVEDDDLSHLHNSAKLRRVGNSPPAHKTSLHRSTQSVGSGTGLTPEQINNASPHTQSPGSVATSATLVEPIHYDPIQGNLHTLGSAPSSAHPSLNGGAVAPPPAASTYATMPIQQLQQTYQGPSVNDANDANPWTSMAPQQQMMHDSSFHWSQPHSDQSHQMVSGVSPGGGEGMKGGMIDPDISMALGIDRSMASGSGAGEQGGHGHGHGHGHGQPMEAIDPGDFDFDAFVNSMGAGDMRFDDWVG